MKDFLFVEKYAPSTVEDCILPSQIKDTLREFRDTGNIPNLILSGSSGLGKTSSIKALAKELKLDLLYINGSSEGRLLDTIRDTVTQFCSTVSMVEDTSKKKIVLFDEFDNTLDAVQLCLRYVIEEFQSNVIFVFTVNNYSKVSPAIISRCSSLYYHTPKAEYKELGIQVYNRLSNILDLENITYDRKVLIQMIKTYFPDIRRLLNETQRYSIGGQLDISCLSAIQDIDTDSLIKYIRLKNFENMRVWVNTNMDNQSPDKTYRLVYNALRTVLTDIGVAKTIILIADYQARSSVNMDMNFLACLIEIAYDGDITFK
jgi:DNA polymerase III delta prime subunit